MNYKILQILLTKCWVPFRRSSEQPQQRNDEDENITANIISNLAHLGISVQDTKTFDLDVYFDIVGIEMKLMGSNNEKQVTQKDIDAFLI